MKSKGCVALIENNKKTILDNQYNTLKSILPQANVIYVYGFEAKKFQHYINKYYSDITIIYNEHYDSYNSTYSLNLANNFLTSDCIIMFGDTILNKSIFNKFDTNNGSQIFLSYNKAYKLGCTITNHSLINIDYELNNYLYNMYYIQQSDISKLQTIVKDNNNHNCFIFEIMNKLIEDNTNIKPLFIDSKKRAVA